MNLENSNQLWLESVDQVRLILFALYNRTIFTRVWLILPLFIIEIIWKNFFVEKGIYLRKSKWIHYYYNYKWVWGGGGGELLYGTANCNVKWKFSCS